MLRILSLVFVLFTASAATAAEQCVQPPEMTTIELSADAKIDAQPDMAVVSAGVITIGATAKDANEKNRTKMNALFKALKDAGIDEKDIQTSDFSLTPQYVYVENKPPRIQGYQANNMVTVKIRDMNKIGSAMDAMIEVGGNQVNGPNFTIDKQDTLLDMVRKQAMEKVMARAKLYADAAGLKIKRVLSIAEGGASMPVPYARPMMAMSKAEGMADMAVAETSVSAGQLTMSASVSVRFELEPK